MKVAFCPQETAYRGAAQGSEPGLEHAAGAEGDALVLCTRSPRNTPLSSHPSSWYQRKTKSVSALKKCDIRIPGPGQGHCSGPHSVAPVSPCSMWQHGQLQLLQLCARAVCPQTGARPLPLGLCPQVGVREAGVPCRAKEHRQYAHGQGSAGVPQLR